MVLVRGVRGGRRRVGWCCIWRSGGVRQRVVVVGAVEKVLRS